jgi:ketosteroid isomerase-like protein
MSTPEVNDVQTHTEANREVITRLYEAADAFDMDTIQSLFAERCVLIQAEGHPAVPGSHEGRDAVVATSARAFTEMRSTGVTVLEIVADGPHRVIGLVEAHGTDLTGEPYTMPVAECFLVEAGQVIEIRPYYWDLVALRRVLGVASA